MLSFTEELEIFEDIHYRMKKYGVEQCFKKPYDEIEEPLFHKKLEEYLKATAELENYVNQKFEHLENQIRAHNYATLDAYIKFVKKS
jgi:hypothetical protein